MIESRDQISMASNYEKTQEQFFELRLIDKKQYKLIHAGSDFYKFVQNWKYK